MYSKPVYYEQKSDMERAPRGGVDPLKDCPVTGEANGTRLSSEVSSVDENLSSFKRTKRILRGTFRNLKKFDDEVVKNCYKCACAWLELYDLYGFNWSLHRDDQYSALFGKVALRILSDIDGNGITWLRYFKFRNCAFFSANMDQEYPPSPIGHHKDVRSLFGGVFYMFERRLKFDGRMRTFACSVLQSKKGMPRPTKEMVDEAVLKAEDTMTTEKEVLQTQKIKIDEVAVKGDPSEPYYWFWEELRRTAQSQKKNFITKEEVERAIESVVEEIASEKIFSLDVLLKPVFPSLSSNYNNTIQDNGTLGLLCKEGFFLEKESFELGYTYENVSVSDYIPETYGWERLLLEVDLERERFLAGLGPCHWKPPTRIGARLDVSAFRAWYRRFYWKNFARAVDEESRVKCVGLSEALKVRVISKGPPHTYFVLKPVQKYLWGLLQRFWNFELTGTVVTEKLLNLRFKGIYGDNYLSGDYSNATDELHSYISEVACLKFIKTWEEQAGVPLGSLRDLMLKSLTGHTYEIQRNGQKTFLPQKRGQLMGSIISFPFLCIANIVLIKLAYERAHGIEFESIRQIPAWINGDDCLIEYEDESFPQWWEQIGEFIGLSKSIGKTYCAKDFLTINSTYFSRKQYKWYREDTINLGIMHGVKRSVACDSKKEESFKYAEEEILELSGKLNAMLGNIKDLSLRGRVAERFLYYNRNLLSACKLPWHLPQYLGGLGLTHIREMTDYDMKFCHAMLKEYSSGVTPPSYSHSVDFCLHKYINCNIREFMPLLTSVNGTFAGREDWSEVYLAFAYKVMLDIPEVMGRGLAFQGKSQLYKTLKLVQRVKEKMQRGVYNNLHRVDPIYLKEYAFHQQYLLFVDPGN